MRQGALRGPSSGSAALTGGWAQLTPRALLLAGVAALACHGVADAQLQGNVRNRAAPPPLADDGLGPRDLLLEADSVAQDQPRNLVTATGHVQARYQGKTIRADRLVYNTVTGAAHATGHAILVNPDGSTVYGDDVTLDDQFRAAVALGFATRQIGNTTLTAGAAVRRNETVNQLNNAVYTACNICALDGRPVAPTWSISASRIIEDRQHGVIYYRNAVIRVLGVPIFYAPVFWHPDPTTPRRSGLLAPKIEYSRRRGFSYQQPYLFAINPSTDLVVSPQINSRVNPFLNVRYTERFYSGMIDIRAGYTYSREFNNHQSFDNDTSRSYILARGLFDVTPDKNWVWGFGAERVTDPTLFQRYGITNVYTDRGPFPADTDRLISQLYTVRADDTSYFSLAALDFQSLRAYGNQVDAQGNVPARGHLREQQGLPDRRSADRGPLQPAGRGARRSAEASGQRGGAHTQQPGGVNLRSNGRYGGRPPAVQRGRRLGRHPGHPEQPDATQAGVSAQLHRQPPREPGRRLAQQLHPGQRHPGGTLPVRPRRHLFDR